MPELNWEKKFTLLDEQGIPHSPKDEWQQRRLTICTMNIILADEIYHKVQDPELRQELLQKVDIVYDMGKRMGNKMRDDHIAAHKPGGWRNGI